ncbi:MAG: hypothetical protein NWF14_00105 [Candidatus Bathyarchaeota archaeon]|nr:hypothetical protein [Candidatus Bathyarchaeota archaeon]
MRDIWLRVGGMIFVITVAYLFLSIQLCFRPFEYVVFPIEDSLVSAENEIARSVSHTLWSQRSLEIILLALLLFVASACCASILDSRRDATG